VKVVILGRPFTLRGGATPEKLQAVARRVDENLRELQQVLPTRSLSDLAVLVALNLAYDCLEIEEDFSRLRADIDARSRQLIEKLETQEVAPPGP
jgi:cell division protein ZapA (FtsZ GTPase activity inhibitor)